ncbi:VWA domain-containing protein [Collinsella sp. AM16-21]|uniref:Spy0128 family protein n=1 Tax=Collinsella sp. AM16-21 TaxID=2292026 RepID=UPI000E51001F|nr:FctA domain-containing protein [Collinsella sp. AM16-21]RHI13491.1 VWA domain-containing protein [Collinsella sp. AM16-21]
MSKYTRGLLAVILAVVLVLPAAAFAMLPEANARSSTGMDGPAMTGKTVVDRDTSNYWKFWAGGYDGKEVTTQNVGRIWTDKTVKAVENGDSDFLTTLSAISSTSDTTVSGKPLDIVLVLDASGSMKDDMSGNDGTKRIDALKKAANSFIDTIATQNQGIADESKQHKVAIVKFAGTKSTDVGNGKDRYGYNYSQTMKKLTLCKGEDAESLKSTIDSISPAGATRADYGLQLAEGISSDRADAKKVVVFFTDGSPTSWDEFENEVANDAINSAKKIKDKGADIYTIGIFSGVNPSAIPTADGTSKENKFMHAVSSNYPAASSSISVWDEWTINFGARAENANYYKSATSASELEKIFEEISGSIIQAGYPTEVHGGYGEHKSGYITFTDELGDFMQVDNFTSVVYNGETFTGPAMKAEGNVDTYTFTGAAANLVITVQHAGKGEPQTGDIVTVKIPASLIPLRHFKITDGVLTVDDTEPIQVNYTSSVKKDALDNLFTPEQVVGLKDYIKSNTITAENGSKTVNFYANKWNGGTLGDTIANFEPADSNRYYYFQKQTPIYVDKNCTTPATGSLAAEGIYYYKDEFEALGADGKAESRIAVIEFTGGDAASSEDAFVRDANGNLSFSKGTARLAFIDELHTTKERVGGDNPTRTAADVLNPKWNNNATEVDVHLGNNGKISFNVTPATVDTKTSFGLTKVLEGRDWTDTDEFKFELSATSENDAPMPAPATATVTNADLDDNGKAAINFGEITYNKPGEYTYEVREVKGGVGGITYSENVATFKVTVAVKATGGLKADVEKISGETEFKNTYSVKPVEDQITAKKVLTGRDLKEGEFSFELVEGNKVVAKGTNAADGKIVMDKITYDKPGTHTYKLREKLPNEAGLSNGITYDKTSYTIKTSVIDNGDGTLKVTHALEGTKPARFENKYNTAPNESSVTDQITAKKVLDGRDLKAGEFRFELVEGNDVVARGTNAADGKITMDKITYTEVGEHTYTLREVKGDAGGITYSTATYTIVTTVTDNGDGTLDVHHVLKDAKAAEFKNSYGLTSESSSVTDEIKANKVLTGRGLKAGEFSFELVEGDKLVATGTNAADGTIVMDKITYDKPGNHTYTLREKLPNEAGLSNGITYDKTNYTIKTSVIDNGDGTLKVTHALEGTKPARFENKYNTAPNESSVTDQITAKKVLDGRGLKAGEFRFELVEGNNVVATGANNADGKIVMDPVTYTEAGEHTYMLRETKAGAIENGITYSTAEYTVVTIVKDNGDGTLSVEHKLQNDEKATFENAYNVTPKDSSVTDKITATKVLDGRDLKEGEFSFELVEGEDAKVVATGTNAADGKITMSEITYNEPGKHTYKLREVPGDANNGITYDGKTYTIETTVTDNGKGELVVKHELKGADEAKFNNSYKPKPNEFSVTDQITATKVLTGRDLKAGEFSFELVEGEDGKVVATGTNGADGTITMNPVKYDKAGTHTYTLREVNGGTTSKGITYDDKTYTIVTTITDKGDGTLEAKHELKGAEDAKSIEFKNSYSVTPLDTELDFGLSKAIDGRDWTDGDEFSFTITAPEGAPLPDPATVTVSKRDAKDGIAAIKFGKIHYAAAGTYKYEIRENAGSTVGMTYDAHVATAEVTVTEDSDGTLTANVTKKENGRFTNTYRTELNYTAAGGLWLSKYLDGRPMTEGQFTFTVTPADDASARALGLLPGANSFKSPAAAEATVGLIDILAGHEVIFTQADAGKTFTYTVAEKNDGQPGYTYDDAVRTVTIAIADDAAGTLTATTTVSGGPEGTHETVHKSGESKVEKALVPFHNSYSATTNTPGGTAAQVVATKTLTGRPMADGEFWFGIAYQGELVAYENLKPNIGGHVSFDTLHYDTKMLADLEAAGLAHRTDKDGKLAWTINYTAYEDLFGLPNGVSATTWSFGFKVIVVDNGDGTLTATVDYGGVEPLFENVYGAEAVDAALTGTKKLQAAEGLTPADITGKFTFTVTADEASAPMPERTTATNDAAGNVDFGKIRFTLEDLNRALGVTDDATDKAEADEADEAEADEAEADEAEADEAEAEEADADADVNADEPSDESEPAAPTAPRSHTFTYTVTESGSAPGVTNDANATRKVSYTVTDDGAGHLGVKRDGGDGADFTFTNTYSVAPTDSSVTDQVTTVKRLTGRDLAAGEFTFELLEDGVTVASGTNDANGNVTLSPIRYEAPGTHTYTLREACPNALGLYKGVTYDGTTYTVVTTVSDNGDGTLTATHKLEGTTESAGFTNKYHAMPTQVSIGAIKVLEGRELKKDEFSFKLVGEDIESTVTNDADGKINFDKFEYDEPGTYVYTISEVKGDEAGMTYDKSVFTATVNVVDDGEGNLKANVAFTKGDKSVEGIVFNNTYKKPETPVPTPDPGTPKTVTNIVKTVKGFLPTTGDQQAAALLMAFVIAMAGVGALVWGIRKR